MQQREKNMQTPLETLIKEYKELGIDKQIDYDKFYLYSLITHSTAIEGSTITELENQIMFDHAKILKEDKEEYIKALVETRENEDMNIFREFMTSVMIKNLANDIDTYKKSIECPETTKSRKSVV